MGLQIFTDTPPNLETGTPGLFNLVVMSGSKEIRIVMDRHSARAMAEVARRLFNEIDREEIAECRPSVGWFNENRRKASRAPNSGGRSATPQRTAPASTGVSALVEQDGNIGLPVWRRCC